MTWEEITVQMSKGFSDLTWNVSMKCNKKKEVKNTNNDSVQHVCCRFTYVWGKVDKKTEEKRRGEGGWKQLPNPKRLVRFHFSLPHTANFSNLLPPLSTPGLSHIWLFYGPDIKYLPHISHPIFISYCRMTQVRDKEVSAESKVRKNVYDTE